MDVHLVDSSWSLFHVRRAISLAAEWTGSEIIVFIQQEIILALKSELFCMLWLC